MDRQITSHYSSTEDFVIDLFCRVDRAMLGVPRHPQARLWPSEVVTLGILFAMRARRERAFYRWAQRDLLPLFPALPERTRLFRLFAAHWGWTGRFLADPTLFGVADSFGIELISTRRLGRSDRQIAKRGLCGDRWIAGAKLGLVVNCDGQCCAWGVTTANTYDATAFTPMVRSFVGQMLVMADCNFHNSPQPCRRREPDPPNLFVCERGQWNQRRLIETVLSMIDALCRLKRLGERAWKYLRAHLAFALAAFNLLLTWDGPPRLTVAKFSL